MINTNDTNYVKEQIVFFSDKCPSCMGYLNEDGKCEEPESKNCIL